SEVETAHAGAHDLVALLAADVIVERRARFTDLLFGALLALVAGTRREPEAGVHDPAFGRHRRPAHVQGARAVHGDVTGLRRQRHAGQVESFDAELRHIRAMRARDRAELAVLAPRTGHGEADGETAAAATVPAHRAVLVPAHVGDALHDADLF